MDIHINYINKLIDDINKERSNLLKLNKEKNCGDMKRLIEYPVIKDKIINIYEIIKCIILQFFGKKYFEDLLERNGMNLYYKQNNKNRMKTNQTRIDELLKILEIKNLTHFKYE
tara:strand:- start:2974 stop:3315 length:342 start_codon:yes stop_codon:yes gene_type:complete